MAVDRMVFWSAEAKDQVDTTKEYIRQLWSEHEVEAFLDLLHEF